MRIGIDVSLVNKPYGVGTSLMALLLGLASVDSIHEYVFYGTHESLANVPKRPNFYLHEVNTRNLNISINADRLDIFHGPTFFIPMTCKCPTVVTVHDTLQLDNVDYFPDRIIKPRQRMIRLCANAASRIIATTHYVSGKIEQNIGIKRDKIDIVYNSILPYFSPLTTERTLLDAHRLHINPPYILYVGGVSPRKNLDTLLAAFQMLQEQYDSIKLVIVNGMREGNLVSELETILARYPDLFPYQGDGNVRYSDNIIVTEALATDQLVSLYNLAEVFIYPSLAEGFGLPPIEAMACGTPVVASNTTSIPEILGDAALLVDPLDQWGFYNAIMSLLRDAILSQKMIAKGFLRAKRFTIQATARTILQVYEKTSLATRT